MRVIINRSFVGQKHGFSVRRDELEIFSRQRCKVVQVNKDVTRLALVSRKRIWVECASIIDRQRTCYRRTIARDLNPSSREKSLERGAKNDERYSFRVQRRDCYPTASATTYFWQRHYFSLNEWPSVLSVDLRNVKLCGLYSHGRVITFPRPPYPPCASPANPSFSGRARLTILHEGL